MFASIVIPALNEEKLIGQTLKSLTELTFPPDRFEVIVADNGSTDRTCQIAATFSDKLTLKIVSVPGVHVSALRNRGVEASIGEILFFLDADCTVAKEWLANAERHFSDPLIGAVGYGHDVPESASWVARTWDLNEKRKRGPTDSLPSGNLCVRRVSFLKIGGFNESLKTNEDFELCFRLRKEGLTIFADPEIRAVHWGVPRSLSEFYKRERWHGTHVFKVFIQNLPELRNLRAVSYAVYFAAALTFIAAALADAVIRGEFRAFLISLCLLGLPPFFLSLKKLRKRGASSLVIARLGLLYLIYGIARARSLFSLQ